MLVNRTEKIEFHIVIALSKTETFSIDYYTLASNPNPHFSTTCEVFNKPKTDYNMCGQCQKDVLKSYPIALNFFNKWDVMHLKDLTIEEYNELMMDIETVLSRYPYIIRKKVDGEYFRDFNFSENKELSMLAYRKKGTYRGLISLS